MDGVHALGVGRGFDGLKGCMSVCLRWCNWCFYEIPPLSLCVSRVTNFYSLHCIRSEKIANFASF